MSFEDTYYSFLFLWAFVALIVFIVLFYKDAPYGRHLKPEASFTLPSRAGWIIMESPAVFGILIFLYMFYQTIGITETFLCCIWLLHYIHRTFIWPLRAKLRGKQMGVGVMSMALLFNVVNITLQCIWIFILGEYTDQWLLSPIFIVGIIIFLLGMLINIKSDDILINLRKSGGNGYHVPKGFFFKYVSSPNYFGEIIEWFGWSLLSMSPAGFVFFIWTSANLIPRARSNNEWSKLNIPDYPKNRKSIIPFIY